MKLNEYTKVKKHVDSLEVDEVTFPKKSGRYRGVSVGRDSSGFFAASNGARTRSYLTPIQIPASKIGSVQKGINYV